MPKEIIKQNVLKCISRYASAYIHPEGFQKFNIVINSNREPLKVVFIPFDPTSPELKLPVKMVARKSHGAYSEEYKTVKVEHVKDEFIVKCDK